MANDNGCVLSRCGCRLTCHGFGRFLVIMADLEGNFLCLKKMFIFIIYLSASIVNIDGDLS